MPPPAEPPQLRWGPRLRSPAQSPCLREVGLVSRRSTEGAKTAALALAERWQERLRPRHSMLVAGVTPGAARGCFATRPARPRAVARWRCSCPHAPAPFSSAPMAATKPSIAMRPLAASGTTPVNAMASAARGASVVRWRGAPTAATARHSNGGAAGRTAEADGHGARRHGLGLHGVHHLRGARLAVSAASRGKRVRGSRSAGAAAARGGAIRSAAPRERARTGVSTSFFTGRAGGASAGGGTAVAAAAGGGEAASGSAAARTRSAPRRAAPLLGTTARSDMEACIAKGEAVEGARAGGARLRRAYRIRVALRACLRHATRGSARYHVSAAPPPPLPKRVRSRARRYALQRAHFATQARFS